MIQMKAVKTFASVETLFQDLSYHLSIASALHGLTPAEIYTDESAAPCAALMRAGHHYLLVGDPQSTAFAVDLREWFAGTVYPELRANQGWGFQLFFSDGWQPVIENDILQSFRRILAPRQYYEINLGDSRSAPSHSAVPEGFEIQPVTRELLQNPTIGGLDELAEEMCSERPTVEDFLARSFGVCLLHQNRVSGWCLSEYNLGTRCEVGIAVDEAHRQRGLATQLGLAFFEQARRNGLSQIGWHCWTRNTPSSATAVRLGLQKMVDYNSFFCPTD
jgi:GNAT superfamily N-acetyltransferase